MNESVFELAALAFAIIVAPTAALRALWATTLGRRLIATDMRESLMLGLVASAVVVCWWLAVRQW